MKTVNFAIPLLFFFLAAPVQAYQAEVGIQYTNVDMENTSDNIDGLGIDGTYYFAPIHAQNIPLQEAAFVNRASNVAVHYSYLEFDTFDWTSLSGKIEYYIPNSNFYLTGTLGQLTEELEGFEDIDVTTYSAEFGYLPIPNLLLTAGIIGYDVDGGEDELDPSLRAKYVSNLYGYTIGLEAEGSLGDRDYLTIASDFYIDPTLSVGLSWSKVHPVKNFVTAVTNDEDKKFSFHTKKFFTKQFSVAANVDFGEDFNTYAIRAAYRF